jgi:hypothetical protein
MRSGICEDWALRCRRIVDRTRQGSRLTYKQRTVIHGRRSMLLEAQDDQVLEEAIEMMLTTTCVQITNVMARIVSAPHSAAN